MDDELLLGSLNTGSSIFGSDISLPEDDESAPYPSVSGVGNPGVGLGAPPLAVHGLGADATAPVVTAGNSRVSAGITVLFLAAGGAAGYYLSRRRVMGAAGGAVSAAAARNFWHARTKLGTNDVGGGLQTGLIGLLGACAGGYLLYSANKG